jgi:thiosulfate dehydrogenase (quinone) large subunit
MAVADHAPRIRSRSHDTEQVEPRTVSPAVRYVWALARLSLGFVFFWAFVDKLFGLGHETTAKQAWIHGGHPTTGLILK